MLTTLAIPLAYLPSIRSVPSTLLLYPITFPSMGLYRAWQLTPPTAKGMSMAFPNAMCQQVSPSTRQGLLRPLSCPLACLGSLHVCYSPAHISLGHACCPRALRPYACMHSLCSASAATSSCQASASLPTAASLHISPGNHAAILKPTVCLASCAPAFVS